ncbi:translation protein SH3-like domain-containing protein [Lentinula lateritia]|nr:translation protein SH3-like domain-containing protein [Lentinula lateritia]
MAEVEATQPTIGAEEAIIDDSEEADKEILLMKQRVAEMEMEAKKLRELQAAAETGQQDASMPMDTEEDKAAADGRKRHLTVLVQVDYSATPEDIQGHFQACGTINRVTILCDKFTGHPKGYAYVEFAEPDHIDAALTMDNSLLHGRLIKSLTRTMATAAQTVSKPYPYSKTAIILPEPYVSPPPPLVQGKGLMPYLQKNLTTPEKQTMLRELFGRHSATRIYPGSIVGVTLEHAPFAFTGVVLAIRRRGIDTSMVLRNVIQRTGVEMQLFVNSPHVKTIKVVQKPPKGRMKRAKLFYLRHSPEKMSALAGSKKGTIA